MEPHTLREQPREAVGSATGQAAGQAASAMGDPTGYFSDMLWRSDHPAQGDQAAVTAEAGRMFTRALLQRRASCRGQDLSGSARREPRQTATKPDAEKRVDDVFNQAKAAKQQAADKAKAAADSARKTGVYVALWAFISLLVGAFSASYMATSQGAKGTKRRSLNRPRNALAATKRASSGRPFEREAGLSRLALHALDVPVDDGEVFVLHALPLGDALLAILVRRSGR